MDNGTLMMNGIDFSNGAGTLVVNGVIYSGGSGGNKELKALATNVKIVEGGNKQTKTFDITGLGITDVEQVCVELVSVKTTTGGSTYTTGCSKTISGNTLTIATSDLTGTSEVTVNILYLA